LPALAVHTVGTSHPNSAHRGRVNPEASPSKSRPGQQLITT
jgi:hypothetical protein